MATTDKQAAAKQAAADKQAAAKQAAADKARLAAIAAIKRDLPQLANPEAYVTTANKADLAGARKEYLQTNLGLDPNLFKLGASYNIPLANKAYAVKSLGLDYTKFAKSGYDINQANEAARFKELGVKDVESLVDKTGKFSNASIASAEEKLIKDVYKLDPANFAFSGTVVVGQRPNPVTGKLENITQQVLKYDIAKAGQRFESARPKIETTSQYPENFTQAVNNYSKAFEAAISVGLENINDADKATLQKLGRTVRDFAGKNISENQSDIIDRINDVDETINNYDAQRRITAEQARNIPGTPEYNALTAPEKAAANAAWKLNKDKNAAYSKLRVDRESITRLATDAKNLAPRFQESFTRYGLSDVVQGIGGRAADLKTVDTGLEGLRNKAFFDPEKSDFFGRVNSEVTDEQILNDINAQSKAEAKRLYDLGTAATTDLQSQITQANQFLSDLPANDPRRASTQKQIDALNADLAEAQKDTLEAKNLFENYQPISGEKATSALSKFRKSLRLPEERTIAQIEQIDPTIGATVRALSKEYQTMAETPLAPTTNPETEALRRDVEQRIASQVALGSQLGAEEQRQYQQAARAAQTARGNIFGVAPAVEEAVTTGLAGEQRLQARLGAAQGFLASGQSMTDAAARDVGLRNALTQSRLGAAQNFIASGPTMYNLASQRFGTQQGLLNNYLAASAPQTTGGFQATPSAANPYAYVNPNAGFVGAQNAASIYNTLADYASQTYGAQVGAISRQETPSQAFGNIASGLGNMFSFSGKLPFCWVAREVYGIDNPKWLQFREWMLTKASDNLRNFYIEYGERIAESIRNKPRIKAIIRKWMDGKIK